MSKIYYVYLITNKILNKQYVGSKITSNINDNYWGSSKYLNEDYKIYKKENFIKEILSDNYQNANDMINGESDYIHKYDTFAPNGYNRFDPKTRKGFHTIGLIHTEKTKQKMSEGKIGHVSIETKSKISKKKTGSTLSLIHKSRISDGVQTAYAEKRIVKDHHGEKNPMYGKKRKYNIANFKLCSYCNKIFDVQNYFRHELKCKTKSL
jgi:hypothetical protein